MDITADVEIFAGPAVDLMLENHQVMNDLLNKEVVHKDLKDANNAKIMKYTLKNSEVIQKLDLL